MMTILVIEDEKFVRENIVDLLAAEDYEVLEAENGLAGLELAEAKRPDLILCDVMMPKLDGYGVLQRLRKNPETATIPFIFLTARGEKTDIREAMNLGADDYLLKPFNRLELLEAIKARFKQKLAADRRLREKLDNLRLSLAGLLPEKLKEPLTRIIGFSYLLGEEAIDMDGEEIQEIAKYIERAAKKLSRLTENLLLYAELENIVGDEKAIASLRHNQTREVDALIAEVATQKAREQERQGDLELSLSPAMVKISKNRLKKLVEELADNAFQFSQPGSPVRIVGKIAPVPEAVPENRRQNFCSLSFVFVLQAIDRGSGMTAKQVNAIADYMQFSQKLYDRQSSGLGLAIAKRIAELHGGELTIDSTPGQGTTVQVILPAIGE
ncbi:MAG: hybrid sensor histidine kinase/response regulator [Oscillatoria sp. SIO1A7]|nr:hybrid sensor histidine kinase/response regulator [Oscillatoria sp. SIO1A7]